MTRKRQYVYTRPCKVCSKDVTASFYITDTHAVLVAKEMDAKALMCADCGLKARVEEPPKPVAVARSKEDEPAAEKLTELLQHAADNNQQIFDATEAAINGSSIISP